MESIFLVLLLVLVLLVVVVVVVVVVVLLLLLPGSKDAIGTISDPHRLQPVFEITCKSLQPQIIYYVVYGVCLVV